MPIDRRHLDPGTKSARVEVKKGGRERNAYIYINITIIYIFILDMQNLTKNERKIQLERKGIKRNIKAMENEGKCRKMTEHEKNMNNNRKETEET